MPPKPKRVIAPKPKPAPKAKLAPRAKPAKTVEMLSPLDIPAETARPAVARESVSAELGPRTDPGLQTLARLIRIEHGLHVLSIGPTDAAPGAFEGVALPAIQVTSPPSDRLDPVEIIAAWADNGAWLGKDGGILVLRSPPGGGNVLITLYAELGASPAFPRDIEVRPLDRPTPDAPSPRGAAMSPAAPPPSDPREADVQITLHIARQGDRSFPARGWVGNLGQRLRIEAFSISPRSKLSPADLEYKAFGPQGRETRWTTEGKLCGTRGRALPLTGFAVQPLPHLRDRFDIIYQGAFFESGITGLCRNGEPCLPTRADDVLEAINLRVVERGGS